MIFFRPWTTWKRFFHTKRSKEMPNRKFLLLAAMSVVSFFSAYMIVMNSGKEKAVEFNDSAVYLPAPVNSYDEGYQRGYSAFVHQFGLTDRFPVRSAKYTDDGHSEDKEEITRGYVDGYHRAADEASFYLHCPR
jgi:hypothetical protein